MQEATPAGHYCPPKYDRHGMPDKDDPALKASAKEKREKNRNNKKKEADRDAHSQECIGITAKLIIARDAEILKIHVKYEDKARLQLQYPWDSRNHDHRLGLFESYKDTGLVPRRKNRQVVEAK